VRLTFAYLGFFVSRWEALGLTDEDLQALERELLRRPDAGKVIPGSGGLRKLRFAPPRSGRGKSGGVRVIYAHFPDYACVWAFTVYGKNVQEDLDEKDKADFADFLTRLRAWVRQRGGC
jgi:hypothetical protein